jgi:hypothetical protein
MSTMTYKAVARRRCQFQGIVWRPGQIYTGAAEPPASVFEILIAEEAPDGAVIAGPFGSEPAPAPERTPSDPTSAGGKGKKAAKPSEI